TDRSQDVHVVWLDGQSFVRRRIKILPIFFGEVGVRKSGLYRLRKNALGVFFQEGIAKQNLLVRIFHARVVKGVVGLLLLRIYRYARLSLYIRQLVHLGLLHIGRRL